MRVAFYYAPSPDDPLHSAGASWFGRDDLPDMAAVTADARRYGFHATLKPPMALAEGVGLSDVQDAARELAHSLVPFALPPLAVADLHGFLALRETQPSPQLQALADACVAWLDGLRAPPSLAELARRRAAGLSAAREANLRRWGYPDVFATWQFHMTLTRRLSASQQEFWRPAAETHFAAALRQPRQVNEMCMFIEPEAGAAFVLAERFGFRGHGAVGD